MGLITRFLPVTLRWLQLQNNLLGYKHYHRIRNIFKRCIVIKVCFTNTSVKSKRNQFGREGLVVKVWWFKTVIGIRVGPRGTNVH